MSLLLGWLSVAAVLAAAILWLRWVDARTLRDRHRRFRLHFPWGVEPGAVTTALAGLSGIRPPFWRRVVATRAVTFDIAANDQGIRHFLDVPDRLEGIVLTHLRAAIPGLRLDPAEREDMPKIVSAAELTTSSGSRPLRSQPVETSTALLTSLQPLSPGEQVVVQWVVGPGPLARPVRAAKGGAPTLWSRLFEQAQPDAQAARELSAKQAEPLVLAAGRVGVAAGWRSRILLSQVLGAFHLANAPGAHLRRRLLPAGIVARRIRARSWPLLAWPCLLNAAEAAGLIGVPLGEQALPGLSLGSARQLPPPSDMPRGGYILARSTYPGANRAIAISPTDLTRHVLLTGPTGTGKSTVLLNIASQVLQAGDGLALLDPKGDLVHDVLEVIPAERVPNVIVLDPSDASRPVTFNPLQVRREDRELMADQVTSVFATIYKQFWGPRTDDILRAALITLAGEPGMTLVETVLLLNEPLFRRRLVSRVRDPILGSFWSWYEQLSPGERANAIGPVQNKLRAVLLRSKVRNILGSSKPTLDFDRLLADQQVLLVPLSKGTLGEDTSRLLGALVTAQLWQAALGRAAVPQDQRPLFVFAADEFQDFVALPTSIGDMLVQARSYRLSVVLANQHTGQLPPDIRAGVLANARTKIIFQVTADDARLLSREFEPWLKAIDLQNLGAYEVAIRPSVGGRVSTPVTGVTLPPPLKTRFAHHVRDWSRQRYGRDRAEIEAEILSRQEEPGRTQRIGRKASRP